MFLPTTVLDTAVKKALLEFGEVYIRITPYKTKHDLPHEIFFDESRSSEVMWTEKKVSCKK